MTISANVSSSDAKRVAAHLDRLLKDVEARVGEALAEGALLVAATARNTIQSGNRGGRLYQRHGIAHIASAPGEPPAEQSGQLSDSINVEQDDQQTAHHVTVGAPYAAALEFGSVHLLPRPFLRPALEINRDRIKRLVLDAAQDAIDKAGKVS